MTTLSEELQSLRDLETAFSLAASATTDRIREAEIKSVIEFSTPPPTTLPGFGKVTYDIEDRVSYNSLSVTVDITADTLATSLRVSAAVQHTGKNVNLLLLRPGVYGGRNNWMHPRGREVYIDNGAPAPYSTNDPLRHILGALGTIRMAGDGRKVRVNVGEQVANQFAPLFEPLKSLDVTVGNTAKVDALISAVKEINQLRFRALRQEMTVIEMAANDPERADLLRLLRV